jgi:hypothetical protein
VLAAINEQVDLAISERYDTAMQMQAELFRRGQKTHELRRGDPMVLSRLFSGLMSAFQAVDPAVVSDDAAGEDQMPLSELHEMVERAFSA